MKTKIKNFLHSNVSLFLIAFSIGCFCHYAVNINLQASDQHPLKVNMYDDFDKKMQDTGFGDIDLSAVFNDQLKNELNISTREDDQYKYLEIDTQGLNKEALKIDIKNGVVNISSEIKKDTQKVEKGRSEYSYFASSFNRSIPIPEGVDDKKAEVINKSDRITIKFPKYKFTS